VMLISDNEWNCLCIPGSNHFKKNTSLNPKEEESLKLYAQMSF